MQQAPSARLTLPPFQINLNSLQDKEIKQNIRNPVRLSVAIDLMTGKGIFMDVFKF